MKHTKLFIALLLLNLSFFNLQYILAQSQHSAEKACLWEVENEDNKVYLLGSIHIVPENIYPLEERILDAYENSDVLVVEADINKNPEEIQKLIAQKAFFTDTSKNLKNQLSGDVYDLLENELMSFGVDIFNLLNMKPWFVSLTISSLRLSNMDFKTGEGIDAYFLNRAYEDAKAVMELESVTAQLEMLSSQSLSNQQDNLQDLLENRENAQSDYAKLLDAWTRGDDEELNKLSRVKMKEVGEDLPGVKEMYEKLFTERDAAMHTKISSYLNDPEGKTYFIVAGIFHFVGSDGIIASLKDGGFEVKQL